MLHLLQPNTPDNTRYIFKGFVGALILHGVFVLGLCVVQTHADVYTITLSTSTIDIVTLPADVCVQAVPEHKKQPINQANIVPGAVKKTPIKKTAAIKKQQPLQKKQVLAQKNILPQSSQTQRSSTSEKKTQHIVSQKEQDMYELQQALQEELQMHWHPPTGLSKDLLCEISIQLDAKGHVHHYDFVTASGVLVYDIHAQATIMQMHYPHYAWGKQLTITFKQT